MKLSNFKTALSSLARTDTTPLVLSPSLTLHVMAMDNTNTSYTARQSQFMRENPKHPMAVDAKARADKKELPIDGTFFDRLDRREATPDVIEFLANVVITGWDLKDDKGKVQPFSVAECIELLNLPEGIGSTITASVIGHALTATHYIVDWESVVTKNS